MNSPISTPEARFAPLEFASALRVEGIGPGFFRLGTYLLRGPVLISPWGARPWGGLADTEGPLTLAGRIDVLIFGGGQDIAIAPAAFRAALEAAGMGLEPMSSLSAARVFNQLLSEGRRVAMVALPLPIQPCQ